MDNTYDFFSKRTFDTLRPRSKIKVLVIYGRLLAYNMIYDSGRAGLEPQCLGWTGPWLGLGWKFTGLGWTDECLMCLRWVADVSDVMSGCYDLTARFSRGKIVVLIAFALPGNCSSLQRRCSVRRRR